MKRSPLRRNKGLKQNKGLRHTTAKTAQRNATWRLICVQRGLYLIQKYGFLICEYSGETIRSLSSVPNDLDDGWGHHIDGNRNNQNPQNVYIVKYKYHSLIHDHNLEVKQEGFEGKCLT